jgi:hypothetical protein
MPRTERTRLQEATLALLEVKGQKEAIDRSRLRAVVEPFRATFAAKRGTDLSTSMSIRRLATTTPESPTALECRHFPTPDACLGVRRSASLSSIVRLLADWCIRIVEKSARRRFFGVGCEVIVAQVWCG